MTSGIIESELKLKAATAGALEALTTARRLGRAQLGPPRTIHEVDRYVDTAGLRLAAAGWACRIRARGGELTLSLKGAGQHRAGDALHRRPELNGPAGDGRDPNAWPSSAARARLLRLSGGEPLVERLVLEQERIERHVRDKGRGVGTLSLDRVTVHHRGRILGQMNLVELELIPVVGPANEARELGEALLGIDGLALDPLSKLEHALAMVAGAAPEA